MHFFTHTPSKNAQSGQIAVIVLLIMAVLLVIGISLANRTSQEITLSSQQQETTRVFNAAETGIEQALQDQLGIANTDTTTETVDNISVTTSVVAAQSTDQNTIAPGDTRTYQPDGNPASFSINWSGATCATQASLVLTVYYHDAANEARAAYSAVNPCTQNTNGTSFASAARTNAHTAQGVSTFATPALPSGSTAKLLRITALYHPATIVSVSNTNPNVVRIRSEAQSTTNEFRAIEVERTVPAPPSIFDYALYSGDTLVKN